MSSGKYTINSVKSIPELGVDENLQALFDMSCIRDTTINVDSQPELVSSHRFTLDEFGRASLEEFHLISLPSLDESPIKDPFGLFDSRLITSSGQLQAEKDLHQSLKIGDVYSSCMPLMPCAKNKLENIDKNFSEPLRSRDKDFKVEQMQLLSKTSDKTDYVERYLIERHGGDSETKHQSPTRKKNQSEMLSSKSVPAGLKLGKYKINVEVPPNFWSPQFQSLIRKTKLMRCTKYISETYCVIDVYGIGINGRIFSSGPGKMIIIEAYSTWNSEKHIVVLTVPMLKDILAGDEALFRPGNKRKLVDTLISHLYFTYTISPAALHDPDASRRHSQRRTPATRGLSAPAAHISLSGNVQSDENISNSGNGVLPEEQLNTGRLSELSDLDSARQDLKIGDENVSIPELKPLTQREARFQARQMRSNDPIYSGLIPAGVDAPQDLSRWQLEREARMQKFLHSKLPIHRPMSQGLPPEFKLFEPGSPPLTPAAAIGTKVNSPNSAGGWAFAPHLGVADSAVEEASNSLVDIPDTLKDVNQEVSVSRPDTNRSKSVEQSARRTSRSQVSHSTLQSRQTVLSNAINNLLPKPYLRVQTVTDIEEPRPIRPDLVGYPVTVSQIMRAKADPSIHEQSLDVWKGYGLPALSQELKVGTHKREKASHVRLRKERERILKEAEDDLKRKAAWLAIPPMKRGYRMKQAVFTQGRMVVLLAYIFPHKPTNVVIKGHVLNECKRMMLNLSLSSIGNLYGEQRPPKLWPPELINPLLRHALSEVQCVHSGENPRDGLCSLRIRDTLAFETQLSKLQPRKSSNWFLEMRYTQKDYRQLAWTQGLIDEDLHKRRLLPPSRFYFKDLPYPKILTPRSSKGKPSGPLFIPYYPMPRRYIGCRRMFSTTVKVQGVSCICTLNFISPLIPHVKKHDQALPEVTDYAKSAWPAFGNIPVPTRKAFKLFKAHDDEYRKMLPRVLGERDLWTKMQVEEKAAREKAEAEAKEKERARIHAERVAMYAHLEDLQHALSPEEFRHKFQDSYRTLNGDAFKHLWSLENSGIWHYVHLHKLNDAHDLELKEIQRKLRELEAAERAADVERWEREEAERLRLEAETAEKKRKVHEFRHNMLHAVVRRDGEDHDSYMMRRMKEAIAMKKEFGLLELEDLNEDVKPATEAASELADSVTEAEPEADTDDDDDDMIDPRNTKERHANDFLAAYATGFGLEMELYFTHESVVDGCVIPAQSVLRRSITREDVYRLVPTFEERFNVLRVAYQCFFDLSTEFEVESMYKKWRDVVIRKYFLYDTIRWTVMKPSELYLRQKNALDESQRHIARKAAEEAAWQGTTLPSSTLEVTENALNSVPSVAHLPPAEAAPKMNDKAKPAIKMKEIEGEPSRKSPDNEDDENESMRDDEENEDDDEDGASILGDEDEGDEDDEVIPSLKPYVPPEPALPQKDQVIARQRILEMHATCAKFDTSPDLSLDGNTSTALQNDVDNLCATLTWPAAASCEQPDAMPQIIFRKTVRIRKTSEELVPLLIEVWTKGAHEMGIWAYDVRRDYHMHTVTPDEEFQRTYAKSFQYMSHAERLRKVESMCFLELVFTETDLSNGERALMLEIKQLNEEEQADEAMENMIEDFNFEAAAQEAKQLAAEKASAKAEKMADVKARLAEAKAKQKEQNERERALLATGGSKSTAETRPDGTGAEDSSVISELTRQEDFPDDSSLGNRDNPTKSSSKQQDDDEDEEDDDDR